jgi:hypothetical protein
MSLLKSRERAQVDSAVEIFSKVEGEIRDLVRREAAAPQLLPNCTELTGENIGLLVAVRVGRRRGADRYVNDRVGNFASDSTK